MDILNPPLLNINGRVYCVYNSDRHLVESESILTNHGDVMWEDEPSCEVDKSCSLVKKTNDGRSQISLSIPSAFFKYIIGIKGDTKRKLEQETKTRIQIPARGQERDVVITGSDERSVLSAKNRIELIVSSKRWREPATHFISIPLCSKHVQNKFDDFQQQILNGFSAVQNVDESIFQKSTRLHLTICTLVLLNESEIDKAQKVLKSMHDDIVHDILGGSPLEINLGNLEYMNDDPAAVDVLYGKVRCLDDSDRLQVLSDRIYEEFVGAGLSQRQYDRVKLHCTLMNTNFRKFGAESENRRRKQSFNASGILMKYQDFDFGNISVQDIHLSQRKSYSESGYYKCIDSIAIG